MSNRLVNRAILSAAGSIAGEIEGGATGSAAMGAVVLGSLLAVAPYVAFAMEWTDSDWRAIAVTGGVVGGIGGGLLGSLVRPPMVRVPKAAGRNDPPGSIVLLNTNRVMTTAAFALLLTIVAAVLLYWQYRAPMTGRADVRLPVAIALLASAVVAFLWPVRSVEVGQGVRVSRPFRSWVGEWASVKTWGLRLPTGGVVRHATELPTTYFLKFGDGRTAELPVAPAVAAQLVELTTSSLPPTEQAPAATPGPDFELTD